MLKKILSGCLSVCVLLSGVSVAAASEYTVVTDDTNNAPQENVNQEKREETSGYTDIDDSVSTTTGELFKLQYEPADSWSSESGYHDLFFNGTDHYSHGDKEVSVSMNFSGTGLEIYASQNTGHANFDVYIDDVLKGTGAAHLESGGPNHKQKLFEISNLDDQAHTLKIVKSKGQTAALQLDQIRVYHSPIAPTKLTLNKDLVLLTPGETAKLLVTLEPWIASDEIVWTSAKPDVVSVQDGTLTAANEVAKRESVTITARAASNKEATASAEIVVDPTIAAMNAYVGNEKLLETQENYEDLKSGSKNTFHGTAWKGSNLNSKIVITTNKNVSGVQVTASDFMSKEGVILPKENIKINWLKEITTNEGRNATGEKKQYPDVIHQGGKKDIAAKDVQFAWVNIAIPEDTKSGTYVGTLEVNADDLEHPFELTYTIEVINLKQPTLQDVDYEVQIWQHPFSVANYYLGLGKTPSGGISDDRDDDFYFTDAHFALMEDSMKEYRELGGRDVVANIVEEAWNHQSYYKDLSMVKWTKKADGSWKFDYTWYDKWIDFQIKMGVLDPANGVGQIKCYSIVPWENQIEYYDEAAQETVKKAFNPGTEEFKAIWTAFLTDFMKHSEEQGWFDITYISMDERGLNLLKPAVEVIHSVQNKDGKHFKISSAMNAESLHEREFLKKVDDISINLDNASNIALMNEVSEERRSLGLKTTFYSCTGNYPTNYTISDPGDNYWTAWYSLTLGTDGFMRWAWDNYVYDMLGDNTYRYWEPGDGWYIYPVERGQENSQDPNFYSTPRYELFKQGLQDVAKAKYLLLSDAVSAEQKAELSSVVNHLDKPEKRILHGAAVPKNEEARMLTHTESERALNATNKIAREIAKEETYVDKTALAEAIQQYHPDHYKESDYTEPSWNEFKTIHAYAVSVLNDAAATQDTVNQAVQALKGAVNRLTPISSGSGGGSGSGSGGGSSSKPTKPDQKNPQPETPPVVQPDTSIPVVKPGQKTEISIGQDQKVTITAETTDQKQYTIKMEKNGSEAVGLDVQIALQTTQSGMGTVAIIVNADGTETILTDSYYENGKVVMTLSQSCTIKVENRVASFDDVSAIDWYKDSVDFVTSHSLFSGKSKTAFAPNDQMTRGMLVTVLYRLEGQPTTQSNAPFTDVDPKQYYAAPIAWASQNRVVTGTSPSTFTPNSPITREQLAVILYRYADSPDVNGNNGTYSDASSISSWAKDAVMWATQTGIITGSNDGKLNPQGNATRAETAAMLMRYVKQ